MWTLHISAHISCPYSERGNFRIRWGNNQTLGTATLNWWRIFYKQLKQTYLLFYPKILFAVDFFSIDTNIIRIEFDLKSLKKYNVCVGWQWKFSVQWFRNGWGIWSYWG